MRLSVFSIADAYPGPAEDAAARLGEVVALGRTAERAGLSALWVAEHHFHPGGVVPQPPVLLGALATATRTIRLGALVSVLPFHAPFEVAEQYAMVDALSGGRLNIGFGSGYIPVELEGFGLTAETKRARFDRAYETVLAAFRGEAIDAGGTPVRLNVRPVQRPHPPIWIAVQRREAIPYVARRGVGVALIPYATVGGLEELAEEVREYRRALPEGVVGTVSVGLHLFAGKRLGTPRAALQRYLDSRLAHQSASLARRAQDDPGNARAEAIERSGFALFGPADDVVARLGAFTSAGVDEVLGLVDFGGLPPATVRSSVRALGAAWRRSSGA
ncbi:MAG TPA: LLM class flavin-dependent oxidoreductase [Thermoplasmata archaeon]|nr:LLM class flavin-dependent oxidoreductase [Thermoplasmata archaeon]HUJ78427.1 LLM class flavin-dependent oxidoreductase [Thermoplasmata archaeon]